MAKIDVKFMKADRTLAKKIGNVIVDKPKKKSTKKVKRK